MKPTTLSIADMGHSYMEVRLDQPALEELLYSMTVRMEVINGYVGVELLGFSKLNRA